MHLGMFYESITVQFIGNADCYLFCVLSLAFPIDSKVQPGLRTVMKPKGLHM